MTQDEKTQDTPREAGLSRGWLVITHGPGGWSDDWSGVLHTDQGEADADFKEACDQGEDARLATVTWHA